MKWPSGLSLGDAVFSARHTHPVGTSRPPSTWACPVLRSDDTCQRHPGGLCSLELERNFSHASKKSREKTTFDQKANRATRVTTLPANGGKTELDIPSCARDALAFVYFARREMGQGRVVPPRRRSSSVVRTRCRCATPAR